MTYSSGAYWEERARQLIESRGATVIARNYTCRFGEIDLIALDSDRLAFIEVRYRSRSDFGSALASVSPAKQQKVLMTAQIFWRRMRTIAIDIVGLTSSLLTAPATV